MNRTNLGADSASDTLFVIYNGKILLHSDSTIGASTHALCTSETSVCTHLSCKSTLVVVGATYSDNRLFSQDANRAVRTGLCAKSAASTATGDNSCNAVCYNDSLVRTYSGTVAKTDTSVMTYVFTIPVSSSLFTALHAVTEMLFILLGRLAGAVATYVSIFSFSSGCFNTKNCCNILRSLCSAGNTKICRLRLSLADSSCISVASAEAAGSAIASGKWLATVSIIAQTAAIPKHIKTGIKISILPPIKLRQELFNDSCKSVERKRYNRGCDKGYGETAEALGGIRIINS